MSASSLFDYSGVTDDWLYRILAKNGIFNDPKLWAKVVVSAETEIKRRGLPMEKP